MRTEFKRALRRATGIAAALTAAAALTVAAAPAASAVPSNPDDELCLAEFRLCPPDEWQDPDWPAPAQYQAVGRDADAVAAMNEALGLVRTPCPEFDVLRAQLTQDGAIWVFTLTYSCD